MPKTKKKSRVKVSIIQITCAFCEGTGKDPFGILSIRSNCQVCGGKGKVNVEEPYIECVFCGGSGVFPDKRITCTVCMGKGAVKGIENPQACPDCEGTGVSTNTPGLPCIRCKGKGVIPG